MSAEVAALIRQVFDETLQEYRKWSTKTFQKSIASLERDSPVQSNAEWPTNDDSSPPMFYSPLAPDDSERVEIVDFDMGGISSSPTHVSITFARTVSEEMALEPHPPYESVTPIERSVFFQNEVSTLPFIPFSDERSFSPSMIYEFIDANYSSLAWDEMKYPEIDFLVLEVARRLREHNISFDTMDEAKVLPRRIRDLAGNNSNRDVPDCFPHKISLRPQIPSPDIDAMTGIFCDNLNCNVSMCSSHDPDWLGILPQPRQSTVKNSELRTYKLPYEPCDETCYSLRENSDPALSEWSASDLKLFKLILEREPDAEPCDLAVVMHKPCREVRLATLPNVPISGGKVFAQRMIYLPDPATTGLSPLKQRLLRQTRQTNAHGHIKGEVSALVNGAWQNPSRPDMDFVTVAFERVVPRPCNHDGICEPDVCECAEQNVRCERRCRCDAMCVRRHRGCECRPITGKTCNNEACACFHERRECDPDLCGRCGAAKLGIVTDSRHKNMTCCFSSLQLKPNALRRKLEVKKSHYGLGLFTILSIKSGELIIEYAGEIIEQESHQLRETLSRYRNRNYTMELALDVELDAGPAGGVARYINHGAPGQINVRAEVYLVNGEHRIGLFATRHINAGEELFLDYGHEFFSGEHSRISAVRRGQTVFNASSVSVVLTRSHI